MLLMVQKVLHLASHFAFGAEISRAMRIRCHSGGGRVWDKVLKLTGISHVGKIDMKLFPVVLICNCG